jgi:hypothetical protein
MFVEFYDNAIERSRMIGCMDMVLVPQAGEMVEFLRDDESWGIFRVLTVKHDVRLKQMPAEAYYRSDHVATKCCVRAVAGEEQPR